MSLKNRDYKDFDELCTLPDAELVDLWCDFHQCVHDFNYMTGDTFHKQKLALDRAIVKRWTDQAQAARKSRPHAQMQDGFHHALKHACTAMREIAKGQRRVADNEPAKSVIDKAVTAFTHAISELEYIKKYECRRTLK